MKRLIFWRLLQFIPVVFAAAALAFFLSRSVKGDPFSSERASSPQNLERLREHYGFDKSLPEQFLNWTSRALRGDLGPSHKHQAYSVNDIIASSFLPSLELGFWALLLALVLGLPIGAYAAFHKNTKLDYGLMSSAMLGICLPSFVLAPILLLLFSVWLNIFNPIGWDSPSSRVLPTLTLGLYFAAYIARLTRAGFLETLAQDYVLSAVAKGLSPKRIVWRHALPGAMSPVIAYIGPAAAHLVTGSFVVESIFFIPGLGRHFIEAAFNHDYSLILGLTVFYATILALFNLLSDLAHILLDPRLRGSGA